MPIDTLTERIMAIDWRALRAQLDARGYALTPPLLTAAECSELIGLYDQRERFRSRVDMARLRFGAGEYKYFAYPLPPLVAELRESLYPQVAPLANAWAQALRQASNYPPALAAFIDECHHAGQAKPTPLMLRYEAGGYNCLHQDLYGDVVFPLQFTLMLSAPGTAFTGGEFLLMEQRPRAQSRGEAVALEQGAAILFPTRYRPVAGARRPYRVNVRHGVSRINRGQRFTLGIIFHDAQ